MQNGKQSEGQQYGKTMGHQRGAAAREPIEQRTNELREQRLSQGADGEARQRNADLYPGDDAVELAQQLLHDARPSIAAVDELAHARSPHGHQRKLRGRKEAVDGHQQQYRQESEPDHVLQF